MNQFACRLKARMLVVSGPKLQHYPRSQAKMVPACWIVMPSVADAVTV